MCYLKSHVVEKRVEVGKQFTVSLFGENVPFTIVGLEPQLQEGEQCKATERTKIVLVESAPELKQEAIVADDVPLYGMHKEQAELEKSILKSICNENRLQSIGLSRIKGVLVLGISGMGKTALINSVKTKLRQLNFKIYQSFNLLSRVVGGSEQMIKKIFKEALERQPTVLVFEDLHLLFSGKKA